MKRYPAQVIVHLTPEQKQQMLLRAQESARSVSNLIRSRLFPREPEDTEVTDDDGEPD